MRVKAQITPEVLQWARDSAGFSREDVVKKLRQKTVTVKTLAQWEEGVDVPSYTQLEKLAGMYKRPLAVFFFPSPPHEQSYDEKFRSVPSNYIDSLSPRIRYIVKQALVRQIDLDELHQGNTPADIQSFKNTIRGLRSLDRQNSRQLATQLRDIVGISLDQQFQWKTYDEALNHWRELLQSWGIWVFKVAFKDDKYCGFYLPDESDMKFPVIYINNSMSKARQIFTLFHELGHLLLGKGGIDFRTNVEDSFQEKYQQEEVFCNAFAGAFLVPESDQIPTEMPSDEEMESHAKKYKVSREVILRKYKDRGLIDWSGYDQKVENWKRASNKSRSKTAGGDYYRTQSAYLGNKYLNLAFSQYYQQRISEFQLADYLGIKVKSIPELESCVLDASP